GKEPFRPVGAGIAAAILLACRNSSNAATGETAEGDQAGKRGQLGGQVCGTALPRLARSFIMPPGPGPARGTELFSRSQMPVWERACARLCFGRRVGAGAKRSFARGRSQTGVWEREACAARAEADLVLRSQECCSA